MWKGWASWLCFYAVPLVAVAGPSCSASQRQAERGLETRFVRGLDRYCATERVQPLNAEYTAIVCGADTLADIVIPTSTWESCPLKPACDGGSCPPPTP
jgi:hypothetical protein